jgi:hypothetical protein
MYHTYAVLTLDSRVDDKYLAENRTLLSFVVGNKISARE